MSTQAESGQAPVAYGPDNHRVIAERVKDLFRAKGITQQQAASALGLGYEGVVKALGRRGGLRSHIPRICEVFGISQDTLLGDAAGFEAFMREGCDKVPDRIPLPEGCELVQIDGVHLLLGPVGQPFPDGSEVVVELDGELARRRVVVDPESQIAAFNGGLKIRMLPVKKARMRLIIAQCSSVKALP